MVFNEHVKIREEKFGSVVFDTLTEKVFVTNETGKEILEILRKGNTPEETVAILEDAYGVHDSKIRSDVMDFIVRLRDGGIVTL